MRPPPRYSIVDMLQFASISVIRVTSPSAFSWRLCVTPKTVKHFSPQFFSLLFGPGVPVGGPIRTGSPPPPITFKTRGITAGYEPTRDSSKPEASARRRSGSSAESRTIKSSQLSRSCHLRSAILVFEAWSLFGRLDVGFWMFASRPSHFGLHCWTLGAFLETGHVLFCPFSPFFK